MVIETENGKYEVDTETKTFVKGDLVAQYQEGLKNYKTKVGYLVEPKWGVFVIPSDKMAKFHSLVSKTHKVIQKIE